jgi:hypothetical protein
MDAGYQIKVSIFSRSGGLSTVRKPLQKLTLKLLVSRSCQTVSGRPTACCKPHSKNAIGALTVILHFNPIPPRQSLFWMRAQFYTFCVVPPRLPNSHPKPLLSTPHSVCLLPCHSPTTMPMPNVSSPLFVLSGLPAVQTLQLLADFLHPVKQHKQRSFINVSRLKTLEDYHSCSPAYYACSSTDLCRYTDS